LLKEKLGDACTAEKPLKTQQTFTADDFAQSNARTNTLVQLKQFNFFSNILF